jgi:hypothetical protein
MSGLSEFEKLNLKQLVNQSECENNTENIRKLKHSVLIRNDIRKMDNLKKTMRTNNEESFLELCKSECSFLYNNYTDIFNKVFKNELDLTIMSKLLVVLKLIEDDKVDQHEGSVMVGKILKELYLDSAIKRADNLDKQYEAEKPVQNEGKTISWKQYKYTMKI